VLRRRTGYRSLLRALAPTLVVEAREARRFCELRGWVGGRLGRFRAAKAAHLDLVPPGVALTDGLIVDVGANVGAWTAAVLRAEPSARVLAVEPNKEARARLEGQFDGDPRVRIDPRAASSAPGVLDFHLNRQTHNGSLLPPRPEMQRFYGVTTEWVVQKVVQIEATTLDELTAGEPVSLLKIDVQGAECMVLAGASSTLERAAAILLEVNFVPHYEGGSDFATIHVMMREYGFVLAALSEPFATKHHPALWADACYVPNSTLERHW
jgi:FkbM family methyltransferase